MRITGKTQWPSHHSLHYLGATLLICLTTSSQAAEYREVENNAGQNALLQNTWVTEYEADDFTDKVTLAKITFIPADMGTDASFLFRCRPYYTNFSIQYTDWQKNLLVNGKLTNDSSSFAKHGYVYDSKQTLQASSAGEKQSYLLSVGGQINHVTKLFKTDKKLEPGQMGMSLFFTFNFADMPSFRKAPSTDDAKDFFAQLNNALNQQSPIDFKLVSENGWQRNFVFDTERFVKAVPAQVIDFCVSGRKIQ